MAAKKPIKKNPNKKNPVEDSFDAKGMAFLSGLGRNPSPSASTREATAQKRFKKEVMKDKKTQKLYGNMSPSQRAAFVLFDDFTG